MRIQRRLVRLGSMFHRLPRMLLASLVVFFSVMYRGRAMCVRRLFVKFRRALMKIVGHDGPFYHTTNGVIENFRVQDSQRLYCIAHALR